VTAGELSALFLAGLGLGFLLAAQVGPVTLLILRSVLRGGRAIAVGLAMAGAVAGVDLLYATIGLAGLGAVTDSATVRLALGLVSAAILVGIGVRTLWTGFRARLGLELPDEVVEPRRAFATALAATAFNPLTIALWTISFPAAAPAAATGSTAGSAALLSGVALGTLTWYCGLATVVALARRHVGRRALAAVDLVAGTGLILFGGALAVNTIDERP
jgi:putative LysE/RhtB family amino acid efflux pump